MARERTRTFRLRQFEHAMAALRRAIGTSAKVCKSVRLCEGEGDFAIKGALKNLASIIRRSDSMHSCKLHRLKSDLVDP